MKRISVALCLLVAVTACLPEQGDIENESSEGRYCRTCRTVPLQRWSSDVTPDRLWPAGTLRAAVVITPSRMDNYFIAFGVDGETGQVVFAYEIPTRMFDAFSQVNGESWEQQSGSSGGGSDGVMYGSFKLPVPIPVGPVGEPLDPQLARVIGRSALGAIQNNDELYAELEMLADGATRR